MSHQTWDKHSLKQVCNLHCNKWKPKCLLERKWNVPNKEKVKSKEKKKQNRTVYWAKVMLLSVSVRYNLSTSSKKKKRKIHPQIKV